ncbi:hypothetical protein EJB05_21019, partial [Eragrostis curvula]
GGDADETPTLACFSRPVARFPLPSSSRCCSFAVDVSGGAIVCAPYDWTEAVFHDTVMQVGGYGFWERQASPRMRDAEGRLVRWCPRSRHFEAPLEIVDTYKSAPAMLPMGDGSVVVRMDTVLFNGICSFETLRRVLPGDDGGSWRATPPPKPPIGRLAEHFYGDEVASVSAYFALGTRVWISVPRKGTFSLDTAEEEAASWRTEGGWQLPFEGRAVHVPELDSVFGFTAGTGFLCACDVNKQQGTTPPVVVLRRVWRETFPFRLRLDRPGLTWSPAQSTPHVDPDTREGEILVVAQNLHLAWSWISPTHSRSTPYDGEIQQLHRRLGTPSSLASPLASRITTTRSSTATTRSSPADHDGADALPFSGQRRRCAPHWCDPPSSPPPPPWQGSVESKRLAGYPSSGTPLDQHNCCVLPYLAEADQLQFIDSICAEADQAYIGDGTAQANSSYQYAGKGCPRSIQANPNDCQLMRRKPWINSQTRAWVGWQTGMHPFPACIPCKYTPSCQTTCEGTLVSGCYSSSSLRISVPRKGTFSLDTAAEEAASWRTEGGWQLPFEGRAVHVPELDSVFGFTAGTGFLCACDVNKQQGTTPPVVVLRRVWRETFPFPWEECFNDDEGQHPETRVADLPSLAYLGKGRFCICRPMRRIDHQPTGAYGAPITYDASSFLVVQVKRLPCGELRLVKRGKMSYMRPPQGRQCPYIGFI